MNTTSYKPYSRGFGIISCDATWAIARAMDITQSGVINVVTSKLINTESCGTTYYKDASNINKYIISRTFLAFDTTTSFSEKIISIKLRLKLSAIPTSLTNIYVCNGTQSIDEILAETDGNSFDSTSNVIIMPSVVTETVKNVEVQYLELVIPTSLISFGEYTKLVMRGNYDGGNIAVQSSYMYGFDMSDVSLVVSSVPYSIYGQESRVVNFGNDFTINAYTNAYSGGLIYKISINDSTFSSDNIIYSASVGTSYILSRTLKSVEYPDTNTFYFGIFDGDVVVCDIFKTVVYVNKYDIDESTTSYSAVNVDSVYFKYNKCFTGICFNYSRNLSDLYEDTVLVSDNNNGNIYNLYNEYDIIDEFTSNIIDVEVACSTNIDLTVNFGEVEKSKTKITSVDQIDGDEKEYVNIGSNVLLFGQDNVLENGIYVVGKDKKLTNYFTNPTIDDYNRMKIYVNSGEYADTEFHVCGYINKDSSIYPVLEQKESYLIKNKLNYNGLVGTGILFTDYDIARKTQDTNAENFSSVEVIPLMTNFSSIILKYYNDEVKIRINTSEISTLLKFTNTRVVNEDDGLLISVNDVSNMVVGDDVLISFNRLIIQLGSANWSHEGSIGEYWFVSGTTVNGTVWSRSGQTTSIVSSGVTTWSTTDRIEKLTYRAKITAIDSTNKYIKTSIRLDDSVYNNFLKITDLYYNVLDLNVCANNIQSFAKMMKYSAYGDFVDVVLTSINSSQTKIKFTPVFNDKNIYFDYDQLKILFMSKSTTSDINVSFDTTCLYNKYTLANMLSSNGISSVDILEYSESPIINQIVSDSYVDIYYDTDYYTDGFIPYTYVQLTGITKYLCLITDVDNVAGIIRIEKANNMSGYETLNSIVTITNSDIISNLLMDCYLNTSFINLTTFGFSGYTYKKLDLITRKKIYRAYMNALNNYQKNSNIRSVITGSIYENSSNHMVFKLYTDGNMFNDTSLTYKPIEIAGIGKNKKTTIPVLLGEYSYGESDEYDPNIYSEITFDSDTDYFDTYDLTISSSEIIESEIDAIYIYNANVTDTNYSLTVEDVIDAN